MNSNSQRFMHQARPGDQSNQVHGAIAPRDFIKHDNKPAQVLLGENRHGKQGRHRAIFDLSILLMGTACVISAWLMVSTWKSGEVPGCGEGGGCSSILSSRWAYLGGVLPVSLAGIAAYLTLLCAFLFRMHRVACFFGWIVLWAALWFLCVQSLVLKSFCLWCCAAHACAISAVIIHFFRVRPSRRRDGGKSNRTVLRYASAAVMVIFAWMQYAGPSPKEYRIYEVAADQMMAANSADPVTEVAEMQIEINSQGVVTLFGNQDLRLSLSAVPTLESNAGISADPAPPLVMLHDWTCEACHQLQRELSAALSQSKTDCRILAIPVARDTKGEQLHRLMLVAWLHFRQAYDTLREEIVAGRIAPEPQVIESRLTSLVGAEWRAKQQQSSAIIDSYMSLGGKVLAESDARLPVTTLPQLIAAHATMVGSADEQALTRFFQRAAEASIKGENAPQVASTGKVPMPNREFQVDGPAGGASAKNSSRLFRTDGEATVPVIATGEKTTLRISFQNAGDEPLEIFGARSSCGCAVVDTCQQKVMPGDKGEISVAFHASMSPGKITRIVGLRCNAANSDAQGYVTIPFTVEVVPAVQQANSNRQATGKAGIIQTHSN